MTTSVATPPRPGQTVGPLAIPHLSDLPLPARRIVEALLAAEAAAKARRAA